MSRINQLRQQYNVAVEAVEAATRAIEDAPEDLQDYSDLRGALDEATTEAERCKANLEVAEAAEAAARNFRPAPVAADEGSSDVRVTAEPSTYVRHGEHQFFRDLFRAQFCGDRAASLRLERHANEARLTGQISQRDVGTGAFAGLTIPQYLVDLYAPTARAGRPFANQCRRLPLPDAGMTINISRITTGASAAVQAAENDAISETDIDDTLLTVNVRTIAGQQDVSRQAMERGTLIDEVVFGDLLTAYHTTLDNSIINDDGTGGTHLGVRNVVGINAVTYTDATPSVPEAYPAVANAIQQITAGRYLGPTAIFMHPRRWGWFTAALDAANRPLVVPFANGPFNPAGVGDNSSYGMGPVGNLHGLPVYVDANIPTNLGAGNNEDAIIICRCEDMLLWEEGDGSPRTARFEQTNGGNLSIKLVLYGYSAFTGGRYPEAIGVITGTGLVAPTF